MAAVETAQKAYAAWKAGDMDTVMSLMSDDVIFYHWNPSAPDVKPGVPISGVWKNKDGVAKFFKTLHETIEFPRFDFLGWAGVGNEVFVKVFAEGTVKATGKTFKIDALHDWTVNDAGLLNFFNEYCDTDAIVKAHQADS